MIDLSQESPLWREWAESRHSVQQMRDELARLIAAAPELVEALEMMLKAWEEVGGSDRLIGYQKGVAALAKAGVR